MFDTGVFAIVRVLMAMLDYAFKAIVSYKDTEQGAAEWLDIVVAYEDVTGDTEGASAARAEAVKSRDQGKRPAPSKINLNDQ